MLMGQYQLSMACRKVKGIFLIIPLERVKNNDIERDKIFG